MITVEKMKGNTPFQKEANYILTMAFIGSHAPTDECLYLAQRMEGQSKDKIKKEILNSFYKAYSINTDGTLGEEHIRKHEDKVIDPLVQKIFDLNIKA